MAKLKVSASLLGSLLHFPIDVQIVGISCEDARYVVFDLEGPDVPDAAAVRAVFHQTCKLEPVE